MTVSEIENKLIEAVASITGKDESDMISDAPFHSVGIDSLGFVEILVFVEKAFKLRLIEHSLDKKDFYSIRTLAEFIHKKL